MQLDTLQIVEDSRCCLKVNAVITKEGVYPYPDGRAFKSRMELLKATHTARNAKITILDHPDSLVIMSQKQIHGVVEKPFFDRNKMRAQLNFDKSVCPKDFVDSMRKGATSKDVSIGFYYQPDKTPGQWEDEKGTKHPYDYVMRDIVIDHVAVGVLKGRCSFPDCGIGVDTMMKRISFGEDMVVQRGNEWCVIHCHGAEAGQVIKCFPTKEEAEAMHRAIEAQKHGATLEGDDGRPPADWWDSCTSKAQSFADDPAKFCGWLWNSGPEPLKSSFGQASVKGGKKGMSETKPDDFLAFVKQRVAEGYTEQQAKDYWDAYVAGTKELPTSIPATPSPVTPPVAKPPQEPAKIPETPQPPVQSPPPPLENLTAEELIDRSQKLIGMREQSIIEKHRQERRHPT